MESYEQCGQGQSYCSLCTLNTIHRLFFVTRLIINKINKCIQIISINIHDILELVVFSQDLLKSSQCVVLSYVSYISIDTHYS
jgi:hypothetical protein